jgi:general L-amino acid transport system permease protein
MTARTLKQTDTPLLHYLRDIRVLQIIGQVIFALVLIAFFYGIAAGILGALAEKNLTPNLAFLGTRAGFDIAERPEWYSSNSTYWEAYQVGLINTLRVVAVSLVLTTVIGVFVGIFLLSTNWLVRTISQIYVEILRNTPLLVQLFIWYFIVMLSLPSFQQSLALPQEGMTLLPVRLLVYLAVLFVIRYVMPRRGASRARVDGFTVGLAAAALVFEVGFWLSHNVDSWANVYGRGNLSAPSFLAYIAVSTILIIISLFVPARWKPLVRGATIGQLIGGIFLYFGVIPNSALRFEMQPAIYLNIRGIALPEMAPTARFAEWLAFVGVGVALALAMYVYLGRVTETTGKPFPRARYGLLAIVIFAVIGWVVAGIEPLPAAVPVEQDGTVVYLPLEEARQNDLLTPQDELLYSRAPIEFILPQRTNFRFTSGTQTSPEYLALLLGLAIYTSAFIAEIVRAGIQAVPHGQVEAGRALGLKYSDLLRLVILPQALRVIIPPLGNQYLNLAKNSSLAIAIAYADLFQVTTTIMNQSGQSVTGMFMVMITYLVISLAIAGVMNAANRRFQLITR